MKVFVSCAGQPDNIGDSILRRGLIDSVRLDRTLHVFAPAVGHDFVEALGLRSEDQVYANRGEWVRALQGASRSGPVVWFAKPGEMQSGLRALKWRLQELPLLLAVKRSGGANIQTALGIRSDLGVLLPIYRASLALYDLIYWRDPQSRRTFKIGELMPDWAFATGGDDVPNSEARDEIVVSLRGDRPVPGEAWIAGLKAAAARLGCSLRVVVQVRRDTERAIEIAAQLGATYDAWPIDMGHLEQEQRLRGIYRSARLVVSDRLHVLIVAATEGAVPLCLTDHRDTKAGRHFEAIAYNGVSICTAGKSASEVSDLVAAALERREELAARVADARVTLAQVVEKISSHIEQLGRGRAA